MGTFSASLRAIDDVKALPATVEISEGHLKIAAGSSEIGSWPLDEIQLEEVPTGYRMVAEGDQILIELKDVAAFSAALANVAKKKRGRVRRATAKADPTGSQPREHVTAPPIVAKPIELTVPQPTRVPVAAQTPDHVASRSVKESTKPGIGARVFDGVDTLLIKAKKRYGPYLPDFMFSRAMFVIALATLIVMVVFPVVFSTVLLISGVLVVLFGAVVYSDSMLASRFLPGRATPTQALLLGLGVLILGVLLGAFAR